MNNLANMIWFPGWNFADCDEPVVAYFRKKIMIKSPVKIACVKISADTRYKLYINGVFVQEGPQKGDLESWHFDTADLQPCFREGENIVAVQVLRFPENADKRNRSLFIGPKPFLYVEGSVSTQEEEISLDAGTGYRCRRAAHIRLKREPFVPAPIHGIEEVTADPLFTGWMFPLYDDAFWDMPVSALRGDEFLACAGQINMKERSIPKQEHVVQQFAGVVCVREPEDREVQLRTEMEGLLRKDKALNIPAKTTYSVEISAGELMCGYLRLVLTGGADAKITIHCAESYSSEVPAVSGSDFAPNPVKTDRTDYIHGQLRGVEDVYCAVGNGTDVCPEIVVSERALREIYLRGFEIAVKTAQPMCIMTSYNVINGIHTANSYDLCTQVAREEWGFQGVIMTDWTTTTAGGSKAHVCALAGNDLIMPGDPRDVEDILKALSDGSLPRQTARACVERLIRVILQTNGMEDCVPYKEQFGF